MEKIISIPDGVTVEKNGGSVVVTGPLGTLQKELDSPVVCVNIRGSTVALDTKNERRRTLALAGTYVSHIRNMVTGVQTGFEARLKAVYSHFPMKITVQGSSLVVQNFMGERASRTVEIPDGVSVDVKKDDVIVAGISKDDVGQAAGRIEQIARVTGFDRRVFQDGIHLVSKARAKEDS